MPRAIVIFARSPQREALAKGLPLDRAVPLFRAHFRSWVAAARAHDATPLVACEERDRDAFAGAAILAQRGTDFGERVANAAADAFARGFTSVAIVAIDAAVPDLDAVFASLDAGRAVIVPSRDGGVNLIGLEAPHGELLARIRPRRRDVVAMCIAALPHLDVLGATSDVDDIATLDAALGAAVVMATPRGIDRRRGTHRTLPPRAPPAAA